LLGLCFLAALLLGTLVGLFTFPALLLGTLLGLFLLAALLFGALLRLDLAVLDLLGGPERFAGGVEDNEILSGQVEGNPQAPAPPAVHHADGLEAPAVAAPPPQIQTGWVVQIILLDAVLVEKSELLVHLLVGVTGRADFKDHLRGHAALQP